MNFKTVLVLVQHIRIAVRIKIAKNHILKASIFVRMSKSAHTRIS